MRRSDVIARNSARRFDPRAELSAAFGAVDTIRDPVRIPVAADVSLVITTSISSNAPVWPEVRRIDFIEAPVSAAAERI